MLWRDVVGLIAVTKQRNEYNELIDVDGTPREVFANKKSVRQSEFYQAAAVGMKPEVVFEVLCAEYNEEPKLQHENVVYHIIRTFTKTGEKIELICSRFPMEG